MSETKAHTNPFPGLRPFETNEYRLFFGREGQSDALIERLQRARFLAVVGTSGSGKSSLVRAGLMPALRGGMMAGAGAGWRVAVMRPGHDPIGNLASVLAEEGVLAELGAGLPRAETEAIIEATLRRGSLGLVDAARQARLAGHEKLLVVVDQFEELFRFRAARATTDTDDDASTFVKLLLEAKQADKPPEERLPIYVVLTMRSDFLGDCAQFQGLPEAINDGQYLIPRMTRDERRFAISGPVRVSRGKITEPLVNRLLNEVGDNPDQLPILQHALMRTWDYWQQHRRDGEHIGIEHYEAVGTMSDALSRHADEAWGELPDERSRAIAEQMFRALTERGADNREIRRPTRLRDVCEITGASEAEVVAATEVFRREGRSFLMPSAGTALSPDTIIDISHESLIRNWVRLKEWVRDEAESARIYRRLADAAVAYRTGEGGLLDEVTLGWVNRWREKYIPNRAWGARYHPEYDAAMAYLEESRVAVGAAAIERERQRQEALARERREREQAERFAEEQRRAAKRLRRYLYAMVALALLSLVTAGWGWVAQRQAVAAQEKAQAAQKATEAERLKVAAALDEARKAEDDAELSRDEARREKASAETEKQRADEQKVIAEQRAVAAQEASRAANAERKRAEAEEANALRLAKVADDARQEADERNAQLQAATERNRWSRDGLAAYQRGDYEAALSAFQIVRESTAAQGEIRDGEIKDAEMSRIHGWALANIGASQRQMNAPSDAVKSYEHALKILEETLDPDDPFRFDTYHGLAHAYHDAYQLDEAERFYKRALAFLEDLSPQPSPGASPTPDNPSNARQSAKIAAGLENIARLYRDLGRHAEAEPIYQRIISIREADKSDGRALVATLKEVAQFYVGQNKYKEAEALYPRILDVLESRVIGSEGEGEDRTNFRDLGDSYSELGEVYVGLNEDQKAEQAFQLARVMQDYWIKARQVLRVANPLTDAEEFAKRFKAVEGDKSLAEMAALTVALGRYKAAEGIYIELIRYQDKVGDDASAASSYLAFANLYRDHLNDPGKAEEHYKEAEEYANKTGSPELLADVLRQRATLYASDPNKYDAAQSSLMLAFDTLSKMDFRRWKDEDAILSELAEIYRRRNNETQLTLTYARRLSAMNNLYEDYTGRRYRNPEVPQFMAAYAKTVAEIADFYRERKMNERAEGAYRQLFMAADKLRARIYDVEQLGGYASALETYQVMLRDLKKLDEAAKVEEVIKAVRARQAELQEIRQQQNAQQQVQQGPPPKATPQ